MTAGQVVGLPRVTRPVEDATEFLDTLTRSGLPRFLQPRTTSSASPTVILPSHTTRRPGSRSDCRRSARDLARILGRPGNRHPDRPDYIWEDPEADAARGRVRDALDEARRFAVAMHGAALLYNVLLAERAQKLGLSKFDGHRNRFATRLDEWHRELEDSDVGGWDLNGLWTLVAEQGGQPCRTLAHSCPPGST